MAGSLAAVLRSCLPGQPERLIALDAAIRAPLPLSTRVGVLAADPDAPSGIVAGLLATVLAARRPHRVLAVAAGAGSESAHLDEEAIARRATARTGAEATHGLAQTPGGVWTLDLTGRPQRWWDAVAPIGRFFDFVVTDWGAPAALDDARAAGGVLLVVASADPEALRAGVELRDRLTEPDAAVLLAVLDGGDAPRGLAEVARVNGASWLPADRGLDELDQRRSGRDELDQRKPGLDELDQRGPELDRRGPELDRRRLRYPTTTAALELAARVVTAATQPRAEVPA